MLNRRNLLQLGAIGLIGATTGAALAQAPPGATPSQGEGPFYPVNTAIERDADLTRLAGRSARAVGQIIEVRGQVIDLSGAPVAGAQLELWQANAAGRYAHPRDNDRAPLDPNFQGYALLQTGADGGFSFVTVKPGAYDRRTPHIHWKVAAGACRLTTQMYFPGEPQNETDSLLRGARDQRALIAESAEAREQDALGFAWTIVLRS